MKATVCDITKKSSVETKLISMDLISGNGIVLPGDEGEKVEFSIKVINKQGYSVEDISLAYVYERVNKLSLQALNELKNPASNGNSNN